MHSLSLPPLFQLRVTLEQLSIAKPSDSSGHLLPTCHNLNRIFSPASNHRSQRLPSDSSFESVLGDLKSVLLFCPVEPLAHIYTEKSLLFVENESFGYLVLIG